MIVTVLILLTHLLVGWLFVGAPVTGGDSADYLRLAENLLSGNGYSLEWVPPFTPTATRPPGYPLALTVLLGFGRLPVGWVLLWQAMIVVLAVLSEYVLRIFSTQQNQLPYIVTRESSSLRQLRAGELNVIRSGPKDAGADAPDGERAPR